MTTTHTSVTSRGFCDGKLSVAYGFGLPHRLRRAPVSVLVGFHSATGWSHVGRVSMGTNTLEMKVIGKRTVTMACRATSTDGTDRPRKIPSHDIANVNKSRRRKPSIKAANP